MAALRGAADSPSVEDLMAEYASIRTALSKGTATDADVARGFELKEILAEIDGE